MTAEYLIPANIKTPQGELQNTKFWMLNTNPSSLAEGLFWFDSVNHIPKYYDGTSVKEYGKVYTNGTGISISAQNVISVNLSDTDIPNLASSKITAMTGYTIASATAAISTSDSLNTAVGKLEYHLNHLATSDIPDLSGTYLLASLKGANNGVASLGSDGKVPNSQLPSFVDDVIDAYIVSGATALSSGWLSATDGGSALTPETGKIYVILSTGTYLNKTYRWSGTTYVEISASPGNATESAAGIAEIATTSEVSTGTDDTRIVTPLKLAGALNSYQTALTFSTGLTKNGSTITVTDYDKLLKNITIGSNSITIGNIPSDKDLSVNIGNSSQIGGNNGVAIGNSAKAYGYAVGLGYNAQATDNSAIQIGYGTNNTEKTLSIGFYDSTTPTNYQLLDGTTGLIPDDRISSTAKKLKYAANNTALTASGGVATWEITHGLGTDDVCLTVKDISTGEIIFPAWKITSGKVTITFLASANIAANTYRAIIIG